MNEQYRNNQYTPQGDRAGPALHTLVEHWRRATPSATVTELLRSLLQNAQLPILDESHAHLLVSPTTASTNALFLYIRYDDSALRSWQAQSIAVTLATIERCRQSGITLPLLWLLDGSCNTDTTLDTLLARHSVLRQARGCLWDGTGQIGLDLDRPAIVLGSKGVLRVALEVQTAYNTIERQYSPLVPNALWSLIWALQTIKDVHGEIHLPGFYEAVRSPEEDTLTALYALPDTASQLAQAWGMTCLPFNLHGFQQHVVHLLTPDCTLLTIQRETHTTAGNEDDSEQLAYLPTRARAVLEFSLVSDQTPDGVLQALRRHLDEHGFDDITVHQLDARPPALTTWQHPFTQQVWQASVQAYGERLFLLPCTAGSLPLTWLSQKYGIPCVLLTLGNAAYTEESIQQLSLLVGGIDDGTGSAQ